METIKFTSDNSFGKFKILNATNGGPVYKRHANDQWRTNITEYTAAKIPYSRNHDSNACMTYGGPYAHDINAIFPDFDADENDPSSYDFACTDESIACTLEAGTRTFFRLGSTIEHHIKKHATLPPRDFGKWARVCEHIIRHYTEGWADGFNYDMPYWEIWNEPDLDADDCPNKRCWGGTKAQFFDFFEISAKHLKSCFPELKIGGPALANDLVWADDFLAEMEKRKVPLDFFSWHIYATEPSELVNRAEKVRQLLDKYGYAGTESILNEWNYVKDWTDNFVYSLESIHGIKGAAFMMAVISEAQKSPVDMLMYYDTRPSTFNGAFDFYTCRPLKGYYPLRWYGDFYRLDREVRAITDAKDIYTLCGADRDGKMTAVVTHYSENDDKENVTVRLVFDISAGKKPQYDVFLLDRTHDGEFIGNTDELVFDMPVHSCLLIKEK